MAKKLKETTISKLIKYKSNYLSNNYESCRNLAQASRIELISSYKRHFGKKGILFDGKDR